MMVCMSDGVINDHQESVRVLKEARKNGVVTFGIFFGNGCDENKLNELYGRGSWAAVEQLGDMPKVVAQRLASIFKSMK
jgi:nitric oxide reductase activation protein